MVDSKLFRHYLKEHKKEVFIARKNLSNPQWIRQASNYSIESAKKLIMTPAKEWANSMARYTEMRAKSGHDVPAYETYTKITKPTKADAYKHWRGYIIARRLIDGGKEKWFAYYPKEFYGKPPYFYSTKSQAIRKYNTYKKEGKFPAKETNTGVVKYNPKMYLNRY